MATMNMDVITAQLGIRDTDNWALEYAEYNLRLNNSLSGLTVTRVSAVLLNAIAQFPDCEFVPAQIAMDPDVTKWVEYPQNFFERIPPRLRETDGAAAAAAATNAGNKSGSGAGTHPSFVELASRDDANGDAGSGNGSKKTAKEAKKMADAGPLGAKSKSESSGQSGSSGSESESGHGGGHDGEHQCTRDQLTKIYSFFNTFGMAYRREITQGGRLSQM